MRANIVIISQKNSIFARDLQLCRVIIDQIPSLKRLKMAPQVGLDLADHAVSE